ncbi:MAG: hypothetical protein WD003_00840 [Candidatus Paceibacterota bacterium]
MRNFNIIISVVIALVVVLGIFWFGAGGGIVTPRDTQTGPTTVDGKGDVLGTPDVSKILSVAINQDGEYLVDFSGMTLYTSSRACTGECLIVWPPYRAEQEVRKGNLSTVLNEELGVLQYTWKGEALYYYEEDLVLGDVKGNGLGGVWSLVRP